jgi:hypothetical protein
VRLAGDRGERSDRLEIIVAAKGRAEHGSPELDQRERGSVGGSAVESEYKACRKKHI